MRCCGLYDVFELSLSVENSKLLIVLSFILRVVKFVHWLWCPVWNYTFLRVLSSLPLFPWYSASYPGSRPASVMPCMTSACCCTWTVMLFRIDFLFQSCHRAHFLIWIHSYFIWDRCVGFCLLAVFFFVPLLHWACIVFIHCYPVWWYTEEKHAVLSFSFSTSLRLGEIASLPP